MDSTTWRRNKNSLRSLVYLDLQDYNADLRDEQVMFIIGLTQC